WTILGTVTYMSPEQACGKRLDFRSDQFSFGSILYEMAAGGPAFRRGNHVDTLSAILHEEPEPSQRIPPPFRWIIDTCLSKGPAERFLSSRDLARDLKSLRDHVDEMTGERARKATAATLRFRRKALGLGVLVAAILAGYLTVRAFGDRGETSSRPLY